MFDDCTPVHNQHGSHDMLFLLLHVCQDSAGMQSCAANACEQAISIHLCLSAGVCAGVQESVATLVHAVHHPDPECCAAPQSLCAGYPVQSCEQTGTVSAG